MTQIVKNLPAMQETQIWSLGWEDPREKDIDDNTDNAYLPRAASLVAQRLKRLPAMWETWVRSLGQEDPLEKEMATQSSILAWRIPWTEEPGELQSTGLQRVGHDWATSLHFTSYLPCAIWPSTPRINSTNWIHFRDERSETRRGKQRFRHKQLFNIRVGFQNQFFQLPVQCSFLLIMFDPFFFLSSPPSSSLPFYPLPSLSTPVSLPLIWTLYFLSSLLSFPPVYSSGWRQPRLLI